MRAPMAGPSSVDSRRRRRRRFAVLVVLVAVSLVATWSARLPLAQWAIDSYGAGLGHGRLSAVLTRLDLDGATARDVRLDGLSAATITIGYDPKGLLARRVDTVEIDGLRVAGRLDAGGLAIDGMARPAGEPGPLVFPRIPVARLVLTDAAADLATATGPVRLSGSLVAMRENAGYNVMASVKAAASDGAATVTVAGPIGPGAPDGVAADMDVAVEGQARGAGFALAGTVATAIAADRTATVAVTLRDGTAAHSRASIDGLTGRIELATDPRAVDARVAYTKGTVQGVDAGAGTVTAGIVGDEVRLDVAFDAAPGRGTFSAATRLDGATPLDVRLDGTVPAAAAGLLPGVSARSGGARLALEGTLPPLADLADRADQAVGRTAIDWLETATVNGSVELDMRGVAYARLLEHADLTGRLRVETTDTDVRIDAEDVLTLANIALSPVLRDHLPDGLLGDRPTLRLPAPSVVVTPDGPTLRVVTDAAVDGIAADIDATLLLDADLRPRRLDAPYLSLRAAGVAAGAATLDVDVLITDLRADLTGVPRLTANIATGVTARVRRPGVVSADPRAELTARVSVDGDRLVMRPAPGSRIVVPGLGLRDRVALPRGMAMTVADDAWLMADLATGRVTYDVTLDPVTVDAVVLLPGGRTTSVAVALPAPRLTSDGTRHSARVGNGSLSATEPPLAGSDLDLAIDWTAGTLDAGLRIARLTLAGAPPPVAAVGAALDARLAGEVLDFAASLAAPAGPLDVRITGRHQLADGVGLARVAVAPVTFIGDIVQPADLAADLAPALGARLRDVAGTIALDGTLAWTDAALTPALRIGVDDVAFAAAGGTVTDLSGTIEVVGLLPPATPPGQRLAGRLRLGKSVLPLTLDFQARPDGRIAVERLRLRAADGMIEARDVLIDPAAPDITATLELSDVDLGLLLAHLGVDGLSGSGRLGGTVPLRVADGRIAIDRGRLAAVGGGRLSYADAGLSGALSGRDDTVGLAARVLRDLRYDDLTIELEKTAGGPGALRLTAGGSNPAVLDGYPFRLNIALDTDFDRLALLLLEGLATVTDIARRAAVRVPR